MVGFLLLVMTALILKLFLGRKSMQWFIDLAAMFNGSSPQRTQTTATTMTGKMTSSHTSLFSSHWWVRHSPRPCTDSTAVHKPFSSGSWISAVSNLWFRWGSDLGLSNQWAEVSSLNVSSPSKAAQDVCDRDVCYSWVRLEAALRWSVRAEFRTLFREIKQTKCGTKTRSVSRSI